uniref:Uncharacterized protein n=1 Tax=Glossina austeni TaxID=7395 RepID=A0A1A9URT8_GLOAU
MLTGCGLSKYQEWYTPPHRVSPHTYSIEVHDMVKPLALVALSERNQKNNCSWDERKLPPKGNMLPQNLPINWAANEIPSCICNQSRVQSSAISKSKSLKASKPVSSIPNGTSTAFKATRSRSMATWRPLKRRIRPRYLRNIRDCSIDRVLFCIDNKRVAKVCRPPCIKSMFCLNCSVVAISMSLVSVSNDEGVLRCLIFSITSTLLTHNEESRDKRKVMLRPCAASNTRIPSLTDIFGCLGYSTIVAAILRFNSFPSTNGIHVTGLLFVAKKTMGRILCCLIAE